MLFAVRYEAGKYKGALMVNADNGNHALQRVRERKRGELPRETSAHESYEVMLPGEKFED